MDHKELYERLEKFARAVNEFAGPLLNRRRTAHAADQLTRAAEAAAANYRASHFGRTNDEFRAKLTVASEEADEARHWLGHMVGTKLAGGDVVNALCRESVELAKILGASVRTANRNARNREASGEELPRHRRRRRRRRSLPPGWLDADDR